MVFNIIGRGTLSQKETSLRGMVYASMFGALTAVGAYIMIPLPPVPITLQTLFVNLAGALLGGYLGALSQVVYILLGVIGLPVFAGGKAGAGVLLGPEEARADLADLRHVHGDRRGLHTGHHATDDRGETGLRKGDRHRTAPAPAGRYSEGHRCRPHLPESAGSYPLVEKCFIMSEL
jgi:hypothetical protein